MSFAISEYTKIDVSWGFAPDPSGEAYSAPPEPLAGFNGAAPRQEGNGGRGRGGLGEGKRGREGKWGNGEWRGKGEVGGITPWLLGDRRPWD